MFFIYSMKRFFGILFLLTGIFAIVGGLFTWGEGIIFYQIDTTNTLIPWADIILTGPLSILCSYGILKNQFWGLVLGIANSGIYIFGSTLVFVKLYLEREFDIVLIIPALSGLSIGLGFLYWILHNRKLIS